MYSIVLLILFSFGVGACSKNMQQKESPKVEKPRVIITTDINTTRYYKADEYAIVYMLWYADFVQIESIITCRPSDSSSDRLSDLLNLYQKDYENVSFQFHENRFPSPKDLASLVCRDKEKAAIKIIQAARQKTEQPLWILMLGNMKVVKEALLLAPDIENKIRLISIGTGIKSPDEDVCGNLNWNGWGRTEIYNRFKSLWWIENDWAYKGISEGEVSNEVMNKVGQCGALGKIMLNNTQPTLVLDKAIPFMFLLDPTIHPNHPEFGGWTGNYIKPFPVERPNYWVDRAETKKWNYKNPCSSWELAEQVYRERKFSVQNRKNEMYASLVDRLTQLYSKTKGTKY
ncbi:hypothetical protein NH26_22735 [Flammeovirga pacifica]|uniref:Cellulose-binding Sde182 nucleoside hydrolase-like domain-containing protein n=2 Tax=Flammeovirga pacifica TaxID=915059 RepID=A0A1S1YTR0_FLAPC|nr:hypothetical protein NH26_22735 [Flammeovirga pacifica]